MEDRDNCIVLKSFSEDKDLEKYNEELKEDTRLTKSNISEKALCASSLRCKWLNYYFFEKENLSRLAKLKESYTKKKISGSNISDPLIRMKSTVALENDGDEKMTKINSMMKMVKTRIDFLERVQNIMNDFPFAIKNNIDMFKLERM